MRHGGKIVVEQLGMLGVGHVFTVPGESFLPVLDALFDDTPIRTIVCRHEGGAAMMAEATGKLTGRPGVAIVTRGPGLANAMSGLHVARQDSSPMLLLVGLHEMALDDRECFQEVDLKAIGATTAKWTAVVRQPQRLPELVCRGWQTACAGRPGPVVLGLPEDMLATTADIASARPPVLPSLAPAPRDLDALAKLLARAERPLLIVGGPGWSPEAAASTTRFAEAFDIPVAAAFRRQDAIDNRHPCYVGHLGLATDSKLATGVRGADLVIAIATRLDEVTTGGYGLLATPDPGQRLVHVHPDPAELGRVFGAELPVVACAEAFAAALAALPPPPGPTAWATFRRDLRAAYEAWSEPAPVPGAVDLGEVVKSVSRLLPANAIVTNGAGNYAAFVHRYFSYKAPGTQLAPASGSMGYGLPAAIAAKLAQPDAPVVAFAGDGCLMMTMSELATAAQYDLPIVVIVANNGMYGTIRMHQERTYPGRVVGTTLINPDFAALAASFGLHAARVTRTEDFEQAFQDARHCGRAALIELTIDPEALTPRATLSAIRGGQP